MPLSGPYRCVGAGWSLGDVLATGFRANPLRSQTGQLGVIESDKLQWRNDLPYSWKSSETRKMVGSLFPPINRLNLGKRVVTLDWHPTRPCARRQPYATAPPYLWGSTVGHNGESMIIQGWKKPVAMSHPFQLGVAKTIHLSGKVVAFPTGRCRPLPGSKWASAMR